MKKTEVFRNACENNWKNKVDCSSWSIPRRELNRLINEVRKEILYGRRQNMTRIKWHCPYMVWSMDDFEYIEDGIKFYVHQV